MAKQLGHCSGCGQEFKRSRVAGRREGYRVVSDEKQATTIQCQSCGRKATINEGPA